MIIKHLKGNYPLEQDQRYAVSDLGLASTLVALGFELHTLERTINPKKVKFIFQRLPSVISATNDYWNDRVKINARKLFDTQKMIKNRLYSDDSLC